MEKLSAFQKENLMIVNGYRKNEAGIMLMSQQMRNTYKHMLNQTIIVWFNKRILLDCKN